MNDPRPVGELLRYWRQRRHLTQLDLADLVDISTRHISFIETGRSVPSRAMLMRLADRLEVPLRERNTLMTAAGLAPIYGERRLDDPALRQAFATMLSGRPGPVNLDVPFNLFKEEADVEVPDPAAWRHGISSRSGGDPELVRRVVDLLARARRPLIYAGHGVALSEAATELTALAPAITSGQERFSLPRDRLATLRELEEEYIAWMIERCGGNKTKAAELLGIDPSTLHRRTRPRR